MPTTAVLLVGGAVILLLALGGMRLLSANAGAGAFLLVVVVVALTVGVLNFEAVSTAMPGVLWRLGISSQVPCSQHADVFSQVGTGDEATCWHNFGPGERITIDTYAAKRWWLMPGNVPGVKVELSLRGKVVYPLGPYKPGLPASSSITIVNGSEPRRLFVHVKG